MNRILPDEYTNSIINRSWLHYYVGYFARLKNNCKYALWRHMARKRGAVIGTNVVLNYKLAKKANANLKVGDNSSIATHRIDLRNPVTIGSNVLIGSSEIITTSHNIDSQTFDRKDYGVIIEDYVWIATNALILPSCRKIEYGAVVSAGAVVVRNVCACSVVSGNPATELRKRCVVHNHLVTESLRGGDFNAYKNARRKKRTKQEK